MKITKKEAQKIADNYGLGKILSVEIFQGGYVSYSFLLKTEKGKYVLHFYPKKFGKWQKERTQIKFSVFEYLRKKHFPYRVPQPVKNKRGKYLSELNKRKFWVYEFIDGEIRKKVNLNEFKKIAETLALYHIYVKDKGTLNDKSFFYFDWLIGEYKKFKKIKSTSVSNRLILDNVDYLISILSKLKKINYGKLILAHSDLNNSNILFQKNKVVGVIDFNNIKAAPRAYDIAVSAFRLRYRTKYFDRVGDKEKIELFLKSYEKINPLNIREKRLIFPCLLHEHCGAIRWIYNEMEKNKRNKADHIKILLNKIRYADKQINWKELK